MLKNAVYFVLSKERPMCFRGAGGTVNILLRKLRIPGSCCYMNFHPVEMGHSTKPNFFFRKFEFLQILDQLLTGITEVCTLTHKRDNYGLEKFQDKWCSPAGGRK